MDLISKMAWSFSANARRKRAELFRNWFHIDEKTKILDLGSENGSNINNVLRGTPFRQSNVFIADIDPKALEKGHRDYGFNPVLINEAGQLPFADGQFDIVYGSSVIEHATVLKADVWALKDGNLFKTASLERQRLLAKEIMRLGKQYFVQTPSRSFPIESHTWLPLAGYLPRRALLPVMRISNKFWVKKAIPDFNLLGKSEMNDLFPDAEIISEIVLGLTKSVMAIKTRVTISQDKEMGGR